MNGTLTKYFNEWAFVSLGVLGWRIYEGENIDWFKFKESLLCSFIALVVYAIIKATVKAELKKVKD